MTEQLPPQDERESDAGSHFATPWFQRVVDGERVGRVGFADVVLALGGLTVMITLTSFLVAASASHVSHTDTSKFKINQLGQQVLAETMLAGSKIPKSLRDVSGVKEDQLYDGWGREVMYVVPGPDGTLFDIVSYGRDGKPGGTGRDADLKYSEI